MNLKELKKLVIGNELMDVIASLGFEVDVRDAMLELIKLGEFQVASIVLRAVTDDVFTPSLTDGDGFDNWAAEVAKFQAKFLAATKP